MATTGTDEHRDANRDQIPDEAPKRFDAVVIGAGPAGEVCAGELADAGWTVAIVERELVAGECSYWGCMPSKALLASGEALARAGRTPGAAQAVNDVLDAPAVFAFRDQVASNWDDSEKVEWLHKKGIQLIRGAAKIAGPGCIEVDGRALQTDRIVVATGSEPSIPPVEGLSNLRGVWTNRDAVAAREVPASMLVLGGGAIGVEMAQAFARLGTKVLVIEAGPHLLSSEQPALGELLAEQFADDGIGVITNAKVVRAAVDGRHFVLFLDDGSERRGDRLLVATGRQGRTAGLGLETLGIKPGSKGIAVDDRMRACDNVWAIGDCTGIALLTHVGSYQGRVAAADMLGRDARADYRAIPRVVYTDPQIAAVGQIDGPYSATVALSETARTSTYSRPKPHGLLTLVSDGERLIGASAAGPEAGEWLQQATLAIKARVPLGVLYETLQPFPSFSGLYLNALRALRTECPDCLSLAKTAPVNVA